MGLDITAYSKLEYVGHHEVPDSDEEHPYDPKTWERVHVEAFAYDSFPHALIGVPNVRSDRHGQTTFLTGGCYALTPKTESHGFRAGSYGGYGAWRHDLASAFNPYREFGDGSPSPEGPFYGLLWFADNEGAIFTEQARILLADFRTHESAYRSLQAGGQYADWHIEKYADWMKAFELAADGGAVNFH